ncbi:alpha-1,3-mannosyltransferase (Alg3), putative [Metarhizium acridum CQMa 102]|uniref:Dol-P-Man:Man(5)GlcNAc(2)-PP-Dol alpha-1,3-mannosyltransferase n=1 Tax=Metarhizium acridum (strain CQMa 102) TaxID=655827 RepID=E9DV48_METAQ|nr:alpha-1,3-mannosyltransferase (Alg3), putative [Metarhizium acridum CQMa 102]EFY92472.1 alpha-1,3-mannosyltransferase (Alg3), putative [Metarhizium acridum CQMa 102]
MAPHEPPLKQALRFALDVANGRHALSKLIPLVLWLADAVLCGLVIWKVPYTEIDWVAYMEQVAQFVAGERDYTKIEGGTGPLVYPAAHVYVYTGLYYLTDRGKNVLLAQQIFAVLYMATLAVVMLCYWKAKRRQWTMGSIAYSWGLGIKMSLLLSLPAVGIVLFLGRGFGGSLRLAWLMAQMQLVIALPFLAKNWQGYLGRAFELSRQFKFEWTVNWRMMGEELFVSKQFAMVLLVLHAVVLLIFVTSRWLQPADRSLVSLISPMLRGRSPFTPAEELGVSSRVTPDYIMTTILSANVVGFLFARSLHYQFYVYLAWATPYLLWKAWPYTPVVCLLWAVQEAAWNTFPSTDLSSTTVVNVLLITVVLVYFGTSKPVKSGERKKAKASKKNR